MSNLTVSKTSNKLPNGPKNFVLFYNIQAIVDQFGSLERFHRKYGDIFYFPQSRITPPLVVISDPRAIKQIFTADPNLFEVGKQLSRPIKVLLGDNSLVLLDGVQHQRQRKLLMPPFHGERMKSYGQTMIDVTEEIINSWQVSQTICIRDYTQAISLEIILRTIFGLNRGERYQRLKGILAEWLEAFNSPFRSLFLFLPWLQKDLGFFTPWAKFVKQKKLIHQILHQEIDCRKNNPDALGDDILSLLILARDEDGQSMSDDEIRDELMTMLFAGHETTASSLAWAFYWIHRLPEVRQKLMAEINSLEQNSDYNAIIKLPYLNAVVSETLRIHPVVVAVGRQLKQPFKLMGYTFEAGTSLLPSIYLTHRREDIYPEAEKFKPERFLERQCLGERSLASYGGADSGTCFQSLNAPSDAGSHRFSPYEFLPFGGGNRRCLGYVFALLEMKIVLATILSQVELKLSDNRDLQPIRRGITFTPDGGVKMKVKSIKNN